MITYLVIGFVVVMLIGNFMNAKPKDSELALDNFRMTARQLKLIPSIIPTPEWLTPTTHKKTVVIYSFVNDDWRLPLAYYVNHQGEWQRINNQPTSERQSDMDFFNKSEKLIGQILLPELLLPFVQGLLIKANSIALVFDDEGFTKMLDKQDSVNRHLDPLKQALNEWGNRVATG